LAALVLWGTNPGPTWQVAPTQSADGNVMVDEEPIPAGDHASLTEQLRPGVVVEYMGFGDLRFVAPGAYALEVTPGTRLVLPDTPPRWFGRGGLAGRVDEGCVRLTTGAGFGGVRLTFVTPDGEVECRGGTLAVSRDSSGTRVEVLEGEARVHAAGGAATGPAAAGAHARLAAGTAAQFAIGEPVRAVAPSDAAREELVRLGNAKGALLPPKRAP
jgi:hypothetical protein